MKVARATYLAGGAGTSNLLAGRMYGIPVFGTMAHSYVQAHDSEAAAFEAFAAVYPKTTLLIDTYDTLEGVRRAIALARKLGARFQVDAVRLDSGDLGKLSIEARKMLDAAGLGSVKIFASSGLDEYEVQKLVDSGAPIDAFGVGTRLAVMEDTPALDMAYKLVEYGGRGRFKLSANKVLYPGRKQVFRQSEAGRMARDVIARFDEDVPGERLLQPAIFNGRPVVRVVLEQSRQRLCQELESLPQHLRRLEPAAVPYSVAFSRRLQQDLETIRGELVHA